MAFRRGLKSQSEGYFFVGADLRVRPKQGAHIGAPLHKHCKPLIVNWYQSMVPCKTNHPNFELTDFSIFLT
jgi:hypothetical protein